MPPHLKPNQMNTQEKNKLIAEFMNFPTKELGGRLTDGALINILNTTPHGIGLCL